MRRRTPRASLPPPTHRRPEDRWRSLDLPTALRRCDIVPPDPPPAPARIEPETAAGVAEPVASAVVRRRSPASTTPATRARPRADSLPSLRVVGIVAAISAVVIYALSV